MKTTSTSSWLAVACWLALAGAAGAQGVPPFINYQGVLTDAHGNPITNQLLMVNFRVYDAVRGGTMIWGAREMVSTDANGLFNVLLGDQGENVPGASNRVASITDVFIGSDSRWLEVQVDYNNSSVMSPRQRFLSSGYAYQAGDASGSRGDFGVGGILTVKSNAVFQRAVTITDAGQEALVFNQSVTDSGGLTVSQKMVVAGPMTVNGPLNVRGNAVFSNDVHFSQAATFGGPAAFSNGVSFRGNTAVFGAGRLIAATNGQHLLSGVVPTNGFLGVNVITTDTDENHNTVTFTLDSTQLLFQAHYDTSGSDDLDFKSMTLFPVKAGTTWSLYAGNSKIGFKLFYWPIP